MSETPKVAEGPRILMVPAKPWPCDHAMLETVYARLLPERGYDIEWVMRSSLPGLPRRQVWHGSVVNLTPARPGGAFATALRRLSLLREVARVARRRRFDVIQVRNSVAIGLLALVLRRGTGARVVFQFSFPVLEWALETGRPRGVPSVVRSGLTRLAIGIRRRVLHRVDLVLAVSERMRADLIRDGIRPEKVVVFPLGADDHVPPQRGAVESLRRWLGTGDGQIVLYFGSIAPERRLDFIIRVASIVRGSRPEVWWVLLGAAVGGEDRRLRALADELRVADRVLIAGRVPRDDVAAYLELSELTVSPIPPTELYLLSSPMKAVESLAAGRAVVATAIPDQAELIDRSGGGVVVEYDPSAFADALVALLRDDERRHTAGASGRAYVKAHRSYSRLAADVDVAYRALLGVPE